MKNLLSPKIFVFAFLLFANIKLKAQTHTGFSDSSITTNSNGFYEYLPLGYNPNATVKYSLIIFLHGMGELGNGSPSDLIKVLSNGPAAYISWGMFPTSFTVAGQSHKFVILTPQFINWPSSADVDNLINHAITHYNININRIYLTGISMGGGVAWLYAGESIAQANRIAAMIPVCGANSPWQPFSHNMAASNLPVWATHNQNDPIVPVTSTINNVTWMNTAPIPPSPLAKMTIFPVSGHNAWTTTYNPSFRENGLNVYEWMLQFKRGASPLPVTGFEFNAFKNGSNVLLKWKTYTEINNAGFEIQRSNNGTNFMNIGFVNSTSVAGSGADYSFTDIQPVNGKNYYRIRQVDLNHNSTLSDIKFVNLNKERSVTVYPNPVSDMLNINVTSYTIGTGQLTVRDIMGRIIKKHPISASTGTITLSVAGLQKGAYQGEINDGNEIIRFRFIKE